MVTYDVPRMTLYKVQPLTGILRERLTALNDLAVALEHAHWNVVAPNSARCTRC